MKFLNFAIRKMKFETSKLFVYNDFLTLNFYILRSSFKNQNKFFEREEKSFSFILA